MNTEQLKYFLSVAKHLNFTKAAKDFYVSQPAISHQISELESELGAKLFHRSTRNVSLTRAGELFLVDAKSFLDLDIAAKDKLKTLNADDNLILNIGYLSGPCKHFLPEIINVYHKANPQVEICLKRQDAKGIQDSLETGEYDIYFSQMEDLMNQKNYQSRKIFTDHYCLICRNDHPLLNGPKIDYNKIATESFLMHSPNKSLYLTKQIYHVCKDLNFMPRITQTFNTMEELLFAVESGLGITILPYKIKDYLSSALAYLPLDSNNTANAIGIAWLENENNPSIDWFMTLLNRYLIDKPELF